MHKKLLILMVSFFVNSSLAVAKDPIIVWPTEAGMTRVDIKTVSGTYITSQDKNNVEPVEIWNIKLTKVQYAIRASITSSKKERAVYVGYLMPVKNSYYGTLRSSKGTTVRVLIFQAKAGLKLRIFEGEADFDDYQLHHASEVEQNHR